MSFIISIYWVLKAIFNIDTSTIIIVYFWFEKICTLTMNTNSSTVGWKGISKNSKCQPSDPYLVIFGFISDMKMGVSKIWYLINQKLSCFENLLHFVPRVGQTGKSQNLSFRFIPLPYSCASWNSLKNGWEGLIKLTFWSFGGIWRITLQ